MCRFLARLPGACEPVAVWKMSRRRGVRLVVVAPVLAVLLGGFAARSAAEVPYPGLPDQEPEYPGGGWIGVAQTAMTHMVRAKQWVRIPTVPTAAWSQLSFSNYPPEHQWSSTNHFRNFVYFVSPPGSRHNYGDMEPVTVRTVAFGAIPVEAVVQISQRRGPDGLPIGLTFTTDHDVDTGTPGVVVNFYHDSQIDDVLWVKVLAVKVDGKDLRLAGQCRTVRPAKLSVLGDGGGDLSETEMDLSKHYRVAVGGRLAGTVDVPAFSGCVTKSGDDVSRLVTATVSGPGNPIKLQVSAGICTKKSPLGGLPPAPGESTPEAAGCEMDQLPAEFPYPKRGD